MINQPDVQHVLLPEEEDAFEKVEVINSNVSNNNNNNNNDKSRARIKDRIINLFDVIRSQPYTSVYKRWKRKAICCHDDPNKTRDHDDDDDGNRVKNGLKWVVPMLLLGTLDLLAGLINFITASDRKELKARLHGGSVKMVGMENDLFSDLWLPLCVFTIIACLTYLPETANTVTSLFRNDSTTLVSLHLELLVTLLLEHIPLATISYFTKKWRVTLLHDYDDTTSGVDLFVTSSRVMFVSLRIVWYAHMEGKKIRKNDKYELNQIFFMMCCLLFAVTLAMPIMTSRLSKEEFKSERSRLRLPLTDCYQATNLSIISMWDDPDWSPVDDNQSDVDTSYQENDHTHPWKVYDGLVSSFPSSSSSSSSTTTSKMTSIKIQHQVTSSTSSSFKLMKKLRLSVCGLYKSKHDGILVEYKCNKEQLQLQTSSSSSSSSASSSSSSTSSSSSSTSSPCLPGMSRLIFKFNYQASGTIGGFMTSAIKMTDQAKQLKNNTTNDNNNKPKSWFSSLKREPKKEMAEEENGGGGGDVIYYQVGVFCDTNPYECLEYRGGKVKKNKLKSSNGDKIENGDDDNNGDGGDFISKITSKINNIMKMKEEVVKSPDDDDDDDDDDESKVHDKFKGDLFELVFDSTNLKVEGLKPEVRCEDGDDAGICAAYNKRVENWFLHHDNDHHDGDDDDADGGIFKGCQLLQNDE